MKIEQLICDQCGARKGEKDNWFSLLINNSGFHLYNQASLQTHDICSQGCAIKALNDFLDLSFKERNKATTDYYADKFKKEQSGDYR